MLLSSASHSIFLSSNPESNTIHLPSSTVMMSSIFSNPISHRSRSMYTTCSRARRSTRIEHEENDEEEEQEYGYNEDIAALELYSQSATREALIVHAIVDNQDVEVVIFKGYSSCLTYRTSSDASRSILPARAVIKSIDRIRGPFDPCNIQYLEQGLSWEAFKIRLPSI